MDLKIDGKYITRGGGTVTIRAVDDDGRCFGTILDASGAVDRLASFLPSGQYIAGRATEFDIVDLAQ